MLILYHYNSAKWHFHGFTVGDSGNTRKSRIGGGKDKIKNIKAINYFIYFMFYRLVASKASGAVTANENPTIFVFRSADDDDVSIFLAIIVAFFIPNPAADILFNRAENSSEFIFRRIHIYIYIYEYVNLFYH